MKPTLTKSFELQENMVFYSHFDDEDTWYRVTKTTLVTVTYRTSDDITSVIFRQLVEEGIIKEARNLDTSNTFAHRELLFRLAVLFDDKVFLLMQGTCTFMDDFENIVNSKYVFPHPDLELMFFSIKHLLTSMGHSKYLDARNLNEVDHMNSAIEDAVYDLYKVILNKWMILPEISMKINMVIGD